MSRGALPSETGPSESPLEHLRLETMKALGDNTRYAIYLELVRSPQPLGTAEVAVALGLHPNTVRPHLERMREVGLLDLHVDGRGGVGRPQHLYSVSEHAPSLGLEPPTYPALARMLLRMAAVAGLASEDALDVGREQGHVDADRYDTGVACLGALEAELRRLGFDPETVADAETDAERVTIAFAHCPYRSLAESNPELICAIHHGMVDGFVERRGDGSVTAFRTLVDRQPCQVDLVLQGVAS
jgi:predicted ArsR family transcriptional regulator